MKLILYNRTHWSTKDLRLLVSKALKAEGMWSQGGYYYIRIVYSRGRNVGGWASLNHQYVTLALTKKVRSLKHPDGAIVDELPKGVVEDAARTLIHEIAHNRGLRHAEMADMGDYDISWATGLRIRRRVENKATGPEHRAAHVERKIKEIEAKLGQLKSNEKRLKTRLKAWQKKRRYYQKRWANHTSAKNLPVAGFAGGE